MKEGTKRGGEKVGIGIDRISSLPDDILIPILSLLSTKEAVQTCILSKRWSNVWAYVPVLKVAEYEFRTSKSNLGVYRDQSQIECMDKFVRFVNGVLQNRKSLHLDTFNSFCSSINNQNHSLEWLGRVAALMPKVIVFYGNIPERLDLAESLFSCASLQKLKLDFSGFAKITIPESIYLPSLKVLELAHIELSDDLVKKLFSGCPTLESLVLCSCALTVCDLTSDVLKMLSIGYCWKNDKMRISCPGLVSLSIDYFSIKEEILLQNMASLATADIILHNYSHDLSILSGLSNATTLKLHGSLNSIVRLVKDIPNCRTFNNLKVLELGNWRMGYDY
ncbi:F-box/RNI-like superfamily protein [Rhynchospora pubera]|uniref:F-box/RNI-like superfamily protein n=1 Tax=Rhynchospora pubera TaxID=906938 RepID=A0AAV8F539_9POAL|nr:F-box/RNI-like superfamily protein [Rhynchospora pubera]